MFFGAAALFAGAAFLVERDPDIAVNALGGVSVLCVIMGGIGLMILWEGRSPF